jgi:hypothetical protein
MIYNDAATGRTDCPVEERVMPRFVILDHDHPHPHFDLMLECGNVLWTWRLPCLLAPGGVFDAERVFDHRLVYLDYEGPVSGTRGLVSRREHGTFTWVAQIDNHLELILDGVALHGLLRLTRGEDGERWRIEYVP